jgi:hypothetical protein
MSSVNKQKNSRFLKWTTCYPQNGKFSRNVRKLSTQRTSLLGLLMENYEEVEKKDDDVVDALTNKHTCSASRIKKCGFFLIRVFHAQWCE